MNRPDLWEELRRKNDNVLAKSEYHTFKHGKTFCEIDAEFAAKNKATLF